MKEIIKTSNAPSAIGTYSQGIKVNGFLFTSGQIGIDPVQLFPGVDRPDIGVLVERISHSQFSHSVLQPSYELLVNRFLDEKT